MIVFQISLNFDPAKEILHIRYQIYISMKKAITLRKIQLTFNIFTSPFFNLFSLNLDRMKRVVIRAMRK